MANEAPTTEKKQEAGAPVKNCTACNKPLKRAKRFYRNGKYYCNKKCAKSATAAAVESKEAPPPADQAKEEKAKEEKPKEEKA